jgi:methylated-DNA-[protein]-cysteine S-methyltransferase
MTRNFALFDTAIGTCGIAWSGRGIVGVQLPEKDAAATRARLQRRFADAVEMPPPADLQRTIDGIVALLAGEPRDLTAAALDLDGVPEFNRRVYDVARGIPPGATLTYGEIATQLGDRLAARDVGTALGQNPCPLIVPCHRVMAAGGKTGGFSANGGVTTKLKLLSIEGARLTDEPGLFDRLPLVARPRGGRQSRQRPSE